MKATHCRGAKCIWRQTDQGHVLWGFCRYGIWFYQHVSFSGSVYLSWKWYTASIAVPELAAEQAPSTYYGCARQRERDKQPERNFRKHRLAELFISPTKGSSWGSIAFLSFGCLLQCAQNHAFKNELFTRAPPTMKSAGPPPSMHSAQVSSNSRQSLGGNLPISIQGHNLHPVICTNLIVFQNACLAIVTIPKPNLEGIWKGYSGSLLVENAWACLVDEKHRPTNHPGEFRNQSCIPMARACKGDFRVALFRLAKRETNHQKETHINEVSLL